MENTESLTASQKELLATGIQLFNEQKFFECHEVLEEAWMQVSGEQKLFLQGIIQVAVSMHHFKRDNLVGARRLLHAGIQKLQKFSPSHERIDVERLLADLAPFTSALNASSSADLLRSLSIPCAHFAR